MRLPFLSASILVGCLTAPIRTAEPMDSVYFGDAASEKSHELVSDNSEVRTGGLEQRCRVILPAAVPAISGGSVGFAVRCDPNRQNYLTVRLWGGDVGETVLYLFHDGKQIGCNLSDWPPLDKLNWREMEPRFPGRFFYSTYLLPPCITRGKAKVELQIVCKGRVYSYAPTYERAQYNQEKPSQGIYAAYSHTEAFFEPPAGEVQGKRVKLGPVARRTSELGPYDYAVRETQKLIDDLLRRKLSPPGEVLGIATAYGARWARQYKDRAILDRVIKTVDSYVLRDDVKALGWFGPGELAEAVWRVYEDARKAGYFQQELGDAGSSRGRLYAGFFRRAIDYQTEPPHRGGLTNQDVYITTSIYRSNLLLKKLAPDRALPETAALDYVYQAIGLRPYKGRHYPDRGVQESTAYRFIVGGPIFLSSRWDYYWITPKGSSKEHGYVYGYGELAQQTATLYELTGDEQVRRQAIKMIAARAPFRVLSNDRDGSVTVRIEAVIGWRHSFYGGRVEYGDEYLKAAAVLGDPVSMRLAQLFLEHNRIYGKPRGRSLPLLVQRVSYIRGVLAAPPSPFRLPMRDDQDDFAWADEGIRTVAFKHEGRRCWMTMNWRGAGINNMARVHCTEPAVDRIANIRIATEYTPSGKSIVRPKERCGQFVKPGAVLVTDGEELPLAAGPLGGMGDFYTARYGDYLIGMNCTGDRTFTLRIPPRSAGRPLRELVSGEMTGPAATHVVGPGTTAILYLGPRSRAR